MCSHPENLGIFKATRQETFLKSVFIFLMIKKMSQSLKRHDIIIIVCDSRFSFFWRLEATLNISGFLQHEIFVYTFVFLKNAYRQKKSCCNKHFSLKPACLQVCDLMVLRVQLELEDDVE